MSRYDPHRPDCLYTRDPSLRFHMSGPIEPMEGDPPSLGIMGPVVVVFVAVLIVIGANAIWGFTG